MKAHPAQAERKVLMVLLDLVVSLVIQEYRVFKGMLGLMARLELQVNLDSAGFKEAPELTELLGQAEHLANQVSLESQVQRVRKVHLVLAEPRVKQEQAERAARPE